MVATGVLPCRGLKFLRSRSWTVNAIDKIVIINSIRGLAFMVFDGGVVEDVVISNVTIETLHVSGARSRHIRLLDTEGTLTTDSEVAKGAVVSHY